MLGPDQLRSEFQNMEANYNFGKNPGTLPGIDKWNVGPLKGVSKASNLALRSYGAEHSLFGGSASKWLYSPDAGKIRKGMGFAHRGAEMARSRFLKVSGYQSITQAAAENLNAQTLLGYTKGAGVGKNLLGSLGGAIPGSLLSGAVTYAMGGHSLGGALVEGFLTEASFRLAAPAGAGLAGMMKGGIGWGIIGGTLGLDMKETLGLQAATYMVGGRALVAGAGVGALYAAIPAGAAYLAGKATYHGYKAAHDIGSTVRRTDFSSGDMSFASANAATMRQQALGAIQKSHMNARAMLGNEGLTYARAIGE